MRITKLACIVSAVLISTVWSAFAGQYAIVRGWEVRQDEKGCFATHPDKGDIFWNIQVAPAGGWEISFDDLAGHPDDSEFPARISIDGNVFNETFISYAGSYIGVLRLSQRLALAKGNQVTFYFDNMRLDFRLNGATAAMLKVEECWHDLTGYDPNVSSRRGSYAFK